MSKKRKAADDSDPLDDQQQLMVEGLVNMDMDIDREVAELSVRVTGHNQDLAFSCCMDEALRKQRTKTYQDERAMILRLENGKTLRSDGAAAAAKAFEAGVGDKPVPLALAGNACQTSKSDLAIVREGLGGALPMLSHARAEDIRAEDIRAKLDDHFNALLACGLHHAEQWLVDAQQRARNAQATPAALATPATLPPIAAPPPPSSTIELSPAARPTPKDDIPNVPEASEAQSSCDLHARSEPRALDPSLRGPRDEPEFDGSDGWAAAEGIDVSHAQRWYIENRLETSTLAWEAWKNSNRLTYLLNRSTVFADDVADFLDEHMGNTAFSGAKPFNWHTAPSCLLELDTQLRRVFKDPYHGHTPLLGDANDGAFVLGYVQVSQMPACVQKKSDEAQTLRNGRRLGLHIDKPSYGDIIITISLFGEVTIVLDNHPGTKSDLKGVARNATVAEGDAYALFGKARYKMRHDAIVEPTTQAIESLYHPSYGAIARVGLTFRYFRRTFLELERSRRRSSPSPELPLPHSFNAFDFVDARFHEHGEISRSHLYTYIAIVLRCSPTGLTLYYLSDGLGADTDEEAFLLAEDVPSSDCRPAPESIVKLLNLADGPSWMRRSYRKICQILSHGVEKFIADEKAGTTGLV